MRNICISELNKYTSAELLSIRHSGTNFSESRITIQKFSIKKIYLKMLSEKWQPYRLGHDVTIGKVWFLHLYEIFRDMGRGFWEKRAPKPAKHNGKSGALRHWVWDKMAAVFSADEIFKCIFLNEKIRIFINISLKFVPKGQIKNIPASVQMMAWHWPGDKPLSVLVMA